MLTRLNDTRVDFSDDDSEQKEKYSLLGNSSEMRSKKKNKHLLSRFRTKYALLILALLATVSVILTVEISTTFFVNHYMALIKQVGQTTFFLLGTVGILAERVFPVSSFGPLFTFSATLVSVLPAHTEKKNNLKKKKQILKKKSGSVVLDESGPLLQQDSV
jgi:hypothetical protein